MKHNYFLTALIVLFIFSLQTSNAQSLRRKGLLGIMMQTLNDSIADQHNLEINSGVHILTVMPNSTFSNLGVEQGNILTRLNNTPVNTIQDVLTITSNLYEGDTIEAEFYSNNLKKTKSTALLGRPLESFAGRLLRVARS